MSCEIITYDVYANGVFWGRFEAVSSEEAIAMAAEEYGTVDVGESESSTEDMTAAEVIA